MIEPSAAAPPAEYLVQLSMGEPGKPNDTAGGRYDDGRKTADGWRFTAAVRAV